MSKKKYTALLLGANGLIGSELLILLLENEDYERVYAISRKKLDIEHPRLINIIADFNTIEASIKNIHVDHFFCCIGTTKNKVTNLQEYFKIDHDYPLFVATVLKNNGCHTMSLVSSIGANNTSTNFYLKLKGNVENSIIALNYNSTQIFRPSLLIGKRKEIRLFEKIGQKISPLINLFLRGKLKDYKSINAHTVASAMLKSALSTKNGIHIYQTEEIKEKA